MKRLGWPLAAALTACLSCLLLTLLTGALIGVAESLGRSAEQNSDNGLFAASATLTGLSSALLGPAEQLNRVVLFLILLGSVLLALTLTPWGRTHSARAWERGRAGGFESHLVALQELLSEQEQQFRDTSNALDAAQAERRRNDRLLRLQRVEVEAMLELTKQAVGKRIATALALVAIVLSVISILVAR